MDRRTFNKLTGFVALSAAVAKGEGPGKDRPEDWKSGQDSPVHDSDRLVPLSLKTVALENDLVRIGFDQRSGAMTEFVSKKTGWKIQRRPELGESFRVFAPQPDRSYNPILGARNRVKSLEKSADGSTLTIVWGPLQSEYCGELNITLTGIVRLEGASANFEMTVENGCPYPIASVEWPVIGGLWKPESSPTLRRLGFGGGGSSRETMLFPRFPQEMPWCGTSYPTQNSSGRYDLVLAADEGLYIGNHNRTRDEAVRFALELKPGYLDSKDYSVPPMEEISGHPVRITASVQHFPFTAPKEQSKLSPICLSPFVGDWHKGADVFRRWFFSWYKRPIQPEWLGQPHSWEQIEINSSEEDLRTSYKDLPRRALQAAKAGITALQVTGWNKDGQDHGNPSHDIEPRLGTHQEFKDAIARIEKMGVHVILFNKYSFADTSTDWYKSELHRYMTLDANGIPYVMPGYRYQTPEQLADMNTRRLAVACLNDENWLRICAREFQKSLDLGASGILYDEVSNHGTAEYCFAKDHGHRAPTSLYVGDHRMGTMLREMVRRSVGEEHFAMAGENLYDLETEIYSLSYIRIFGQDHLPFARYNDPRAEIMIAVDGFDDRGIINAALRYRYIMSFESFNFKGNIDDFPITMAYGQKMNAFRERYRKYVWDAEFRDDQDAQVTTNGKPHQDFSVFVAADGRRGAVVVNQGAREMGARVAFDGGSKSQLLWASPEQMQAQAAGEEVRILPRSVVLVMES